MERCDKTAAGTLRSFVLLMYACTFDIYMYYVPYYIKSKLLSRGVQGTVTLIVPR